MSEIAPGLNDKEQALVNLHNNLLGAFHSLYFGKKRPVPESLTNMMQPKELPQPQQTIPQEVPEPVGPARPIIGQSLPVGLAGIASRLLSRR